MISIITAVHNQLAVNKIFHKSLRRYTKLPYIGNTVLMKLSALEKVGFWDERIYGVDYDLYIRSLALD